MRKTNKGKGIEISYKVSIMTKIDYSTQVIRVVFAYKP